ADEQQGELVEGRDARQRIGAVLGHALPREARFLDLAEHDPRRARPQPRVLAARGARLRIGGRVEVRLQSLAPALGATVDVSDLELSARAEGAAAALLAAPAELLEGTRVVPGRAQEFTGPEGRLDRARAVLGMEQTHGLVGAHGEVEPRLLLRALL